MKIHIEALLYLFPLTIVISFLLAIWQGSTEWGLTGLLFLLLSVTVFGFFVGIHDRIPKFLDREWGVY